MRRLGIPLAAFAACQGALADEPWRAVDLGDVVVTAPAMADPFTVITDPKAPQQPIPASDGGSYLKNIPGFSVSRKGGTDGDPAFRGMGGSRLNILLDDAYILGGCPNRMDPPTAYVYPESYDEVVVQKGPQTVLYGPSAGATVRFERRTERFEAKGVRAAGSLVGGSFGRNDQLIDVTAGARAGFLRMIGTRSDSDNYEDANGGEVHSFYTRWSGTAIAGWTPGEDTRLELTVDRSDGEAAYADRAMDGAAFDRTGYALSFERQVLGSRVEQVELKAYHNYVDHVMDNFSLRDPAGMRRIMNPERTTQGARASMRVGLGPETFATLGADYQTNEHTTRMAMAMMTDPSVSGLPRRDKARFERMGLFGELEHDLDANDRLVAGLRADRAEAEARQQSTMMDPDAYGGASAGDTDEDTILSAFLRHEHRLESMPVTLYTGIGRAERSPDFWERDRVFGLDTEKSTQLDVGLSYRIGAVSASLAMFYADIQDYILITDQGTSAKNIAATSYGGEADLQYTLTQRWRLKGTLAYAHGDNDTDDVPLGQMPPLEATLGVSYDDTRYSGGVFLRAADRQDRIDVGSGTIYGTDIGETAGFAVVSVNAGYRPTKRLTVTAGIDNLLDKVYAEHLARGAADLGAVTDLVNEPGRTFWLKVSGEL